MRPPGGGATGVDVSRGIQASTVKFQIVCIWVNSFQRNLTSRNLNPTLLFFNPEKETTY